MYGLGGIQPVSQGKYLGLPMVISRSKGQLFGYIKDNIKRRMLSWKNKLLSSAGKEILIKAVAMAMPNYTMSCFKLPCRLCKEISSMLSNFWWGEKDNKNKVHWVAWKQLTREKKRGGMGFQDIQSFNRALLAKQIWRIIRNPNLLSSRILKSKYFPNCSVLDSRTPNNASWFWQSIMSAREELQWGIRKRIGNGLSTRIWDDQWIPNQHLGRPITTKPGDCQVQKVADLIEGYRWNRNLIFKNFKKEDAENILKIPISITGREDNIFWTENQKGEYTVQSGYKAIQAKNEQEGRGEREGIEASYRPRRTDMWRVLWKLKISHKVKIFIWKGLKEAIPVKELIWRRMSKGDPICSGCGEELETLEHLLLKCKKAKEVWKAAPVQWDGI